jgi:sulfopyruvate decarboxylase subunit beta
LTSSMPRMKRDAALRALARHVTDEIVVSVYQTAFDWRAVGDRDLNFFAFGAMGQASSNALGLALGRPDKRVLVFDGDGSLLMNLGTLVSIANAAPGNLVHFVFQNDCYEANGSHPIPGAGQVDFAKLAEGAGFKFVRTYSQLEDLERDAHLLVAAPGPAFVALHIEQGTPAAQDYEFIHSADARATFKRALAASCS